MRDYYYELTERGELLLDGALQDDPWFLDFFFRRLAPTANPEYPEYPYVCRCGDEMNYLRPADTPIVYTGLSEGRLLYASTLSVPFYPDRLAYSEEGVLYHGATLGEFARLVPSVATEVAQAIEPWGPYYAFVDPFRIQRIPLLPLHQRNAISILRPRRENGCVGCGGANPSSLLLSFVHNRVHGTIQTWLKPDERMQGALGTTHGGFVSLLLDETMGKALSVLGIRAPTARLSVNFRQPMLVGKEYEVRSWISSQEGRKKYVNAEIRASDDPTRIVAEADALFIALSPPANT